MPLPTCHGRRRLHWAAEASTSEAVGSSGIGRLVFSLWAAAATSSVVTLAWVVPCALPSRSASGCQRYTAEPVVTSQRSLSTAVPSPTLTGCRGLDRAADAPPQGAVGRVGIGLLGLRRWVAAAVAKVTPGALDFMVLVCSCHLGPRRLSPWEAVVGGNGIRTRGTLPAVLDVWPPFAAAETRGPSILHRASRRGDVRANVTIGLARRGTHRARLRRRHAGRSKNACGGTVAPPRTAGGTPLCGRRRRCYFFFFIRVPLLGTAWRWPRSPPARPRGRLAARGSAGGRVVPCAEGPLSSDIGQAAPRPRAAGASVSSGPDGQSKGAESENADTDSGSLEAVPVPSRSPLGGGLGGKGRRQRLSSAGGNVGRLPAVTVITRPRSGLVTLAPPPSTLEAAAVPFLSGAALWRMGSLPPVRGRIGATEPGPRWSRGPPVGWP